MWKVPSWLWIVILAPFIAIGLVFFYLGWATPAGILDGGGALVKNYFYVMGAGFTIFPTLMTGIAYLFYKMSNDREARLLKNGIRGEAEILYRAQTGFYVNYQPQIRFTLKVTLPGKAPYQIEHKQVVGMIDVGLYNPGLVVPVVVDPRNPKRMLVGYGGYIPGDRVAPSV